jgi:hypothetical protein
VRVAVVDRLVPVRVAVVDRLVPVRPVVEVVVVVAVELAELAHGERLTPFR